MNRMALERPRGRSLPMTLGAFGALGLMFGVWQVVLPDLSRELRLSPGTLGATLSAGFVGSLPAMLLGGRAADRFGAGVIVTVSAILMALALAGIVAAGSLWALVVLLVVLFGFSGVYDVGMNAAGMALEQETGRKLMPFLHAAFSGGGAIGAVLAGALLASGVSFRIIYLVPVAALAGLALFATRGLGGRLLPAAPDAGPAARGRLHPAIFLMAAITAMGFLSEGAMETWSAIYLRSFLALPAALGAAGVAVFHSAMMVGRLLTGSAILRFGRPGVLRWAGALAVAGMLLALSTSQVLLILAGFLVVGLALSGVAPIAFSLAGDLAPGQSGRASAAITTVGYGGLLFGPVIIGGLAEAVGLRLALLTVAACGALILVLSLRLEDLRQD